MLEGTPGTQRERVIEALTRRGMARLTELKKHGITATTISRMEQEGSIVRLGRGLYQLPDAPIEEHHALAEAAKLAPRAVVCLVSALAFHELTDRIPSRVWMAIGPKDWRPRALYPPMRFVRFAAASFGHCIETRMIEGVEVKITNPPRTVVDAFKYRRTVGEDLAIEGLKEALRTRKATPAQIYDLANQARQWRVIRPYLEAMTLNG